LDPATLFATNLGVIDRVITSVCRRARWFGADAEDFASSARLALMENDYAALRRFEGRSSLPTFVAIVVHRLLMDEWTRRAGKWHASREAERLGPAAIELEKIVRRDHRTIDEALPIVKAIDPAVTREALANIEARLPPRDPRPRAVELDPESALFAAAERTDERVIASDAQQISDRASSAIRDTLAAMPLEDRMIVRMHFGESIPLKEVAELLRLPQRPLYRRLEGLVKKLRNALVDAGIDAGDARELIGSAYAVMDFGLRNGNSAGARRTTLEEAG